MYRIEAHTEENGTLIDQSSPEFLGDAYNEEYATH